MDWWQYPLKPNSHGSTFHTTQVYECQKIWFNCHCCVISSNRIQVSPSASSSRRYSCGYCQSEDFVSTLRQLDGQLVKWKVIKMKKLATVRAQFFLWWLLSTMKNVLPTCSLALNDSMVVVVEITTVFSVKLSLDEYIPLKN